MAEDKKSHLPDSLDSLVSAGELAQLNLYRDYISRIGNAEKLTLAEKKHFDELNRQFSELGNEEVPKNRFTGKEVMEHLGIDKRMLSYHTTRGNLRKEKDGTYTIESVRKWEEKYRRKDTGSGGSSNIMLKKDRADLRFRLAQARKAELIYQQVKGEMMPVDEVHREWATRVNVLFSGLKLWPNRLSPRLEGKTRDEMIQIMEDEIFILMKTFAEKGRYCPDVEK